MKLLVTIFVSIVCLGALGAFLEEKTMPSFEIILPSGKSVDITNKVKTSKSENDIKKALKDAFETDFKKPNE